MQGTLNKIIPLVTGTGGYADIVIDGTKYRLNPYTMAYIDMTQDWPKYQMAGIIPASFQGYIEDFGMFEGYQVAYELKADGTLAYLNVLSGTKPSHTLRNILIGVGVIGGLAAIIAMVRSGRRR